MEGDRALLLRVARDVGDRVRVKLIHTDPERGFIDFARIRHDAAAPLPG